MGFFGKNDAWRNHPKLNGNFRFAFPGFGLGVGLFLVYVAYDQIAERTHARFGSKKHH
ncbi:mitochondrial Complex I CI NADH:ubiquinone oxidoreductase subunit B12/NB2M/NDUFB3 [Andalucia godoyi]|uniref:Mitochondrial Complex I CI NADH:ubiquinone oxidoreductase subunit B12/NB2M/NDUFB3 n=1 Tax=Andalucia godoyi TaxID=505711 RepID=A0A8K0AI78_ANDGO|nr:mitochondrial Complex I CI NADH:ubiquinone oxidoreductase subunit B12/NB2M/NDUFB3 [Andalucia godoyi]|eukprot:ANDGO_08786.mRNA.1 mitochondrial Complex I CI NADH:ubiquinone oxidoreductase subunit B12/NB2M/NDUFB3